MNQEQPHPEPDALALALRRRIEVYRRHLHAGVSGPRIIAYLRQIAEDEEMLSELTRGQAA